MKNNYLSQKSCLILLFALLPFLFYGQTEKTENTEVNKSEVKFEPHWLINANIGAMQYYGDVAEKSDPFSQMAHGTAWGYGIILGRQFSPVLGLRGQFLAGKIKSKKDKYKGGAPANLSFESTVIEFNVHGTVNFSNWFFKYKPDRLFSIYGFLGIGLTNFEGETKQNGKIIHSFGHGAGKGLGGRQIEGVIPIGTGLEIRLNDKFTVNLETSMHGVGNDELDGVKGGSDYDVYGYTSAGLTYKFNFTSGLNKMLNEYENVTFESTSEVLEENNDKIEVEIKGNIPEKYFNKKAAMLFTPVLTYEGGETMLEPITLQGEEVIGDGIVINYNEGGNFTYTDVIDYVPGMNKSELSVTPIAYIVKETIHKNGQDIKIRETFIELGERKLADGVIYTSKRIVNDENILISPHKFVKSSIAIEKAEIFFPVNKYYLNWKLPLNKEIQSKDKLKGISEFIEKGWKIKNIKIDGWASPEGEETFNENLSENRAKTATTYMQKAIKKLIRAKNSLIAIKDSKKDIDYIVNFHGPDWKGFLIDLQKSSIADKKIILNVIKSASPEKREQEIRNMILIYPEIEETILPPLRRANITVDCFEPKRTDGEIAKLSTTHPDSLSINELLYSATLTKDVKAKNRIYKSASILYPKCWRALSDAAATETKLGNLEKAEVYLQKAIKIAPNSGIIENNLGVVNCRLNEYSKAEDHFNKAQKLGENENYNLGIIMITKGEYDEAIKLFGRTKCKYNIGLAYLLNKDFDQAEKALKCAPKTAETFYLLAIIGAKTENTSLMYENLVKAIKINKAYKIQAKNDREFLQYENEPDFQSLVN